LLRVAQIKLGPFENIVQSFRINTMAENVTKLAVLAQQSPPALDDLLACNERSAAGMVLGLAKLRKTSTALVTLPSLMQAQSPLWTRALVDNHWPSKTNQVLRRIDLGDTARSTKHGNASSMFFRSSNNHFGGTQSFPLILCDLWVALKGG